MGRRRPPRVRRDDRVPEGHDRDDRAEEYGRCRAGRWVTWIDETGCVLDEHDDLLGHR